MFTAVTSSLSFSVAMPEPLIANAAK